ncbi:ETX/MTX2 family pore-forming toxin [Bacillus cereus]|uniref:ETX/MTX2 family pore-forming toxin n=1 Tax=Bacillus thuringiensis TaxID=1428 RepID=UPI001876DDB8|nr:ETX/MTX2 family pore-forming toxin [Bacillus thuringiensis]MBE5091941.1 ETX/MTX2 family pore-forming toxin [Bacillus thuringiensis]
MKKFKKALLIAPLACMLGTGMLILPNGAHASEKQLAPGEASPYTEYYGDKASQENLAKTLFPQLRYGIEATPYLREKFKMKSNERFLYTTFDDMNKLKEVETVLLGTSSELQPADVTVEDNGMIILGSYTNATPVTQTRTTPSKTFSVSENFNFSQALGLKIGVEVSTKFKVGFGNIIGGEVGAKTSTEFTATSTFGYAKGTQDTITYPSQNIQLAPNGKTEYFSKVKKAKFSGTFIADTYLKNLTVQGIIIDKTTNKEEHRETVTLTPEDLYYIYKNGPAPIAHYMKLDHENKRISAKAPFNYSGESGFYDQVEVKFTPFSTSSINGKVRKLELPTKTMTYEEYVKAIKNKTL